MKTLLLFRHAKSDWEAEFADDHQRPLNKRGKRDAKRMGRYLVGVGSVPGRVVSSSAVRARKTVELAAAAGEWNCEIEVEDGLYGADAARILALIQKQPDTNDALMLAGHEPSFSEAASVLIGGGSLRLPTAAVACIEFETDRWADVRPGDGRLLWLLTPNVVGEAAKQE
jgi:phosphohistidine phosphatase